LILAGDVLFAGGTNKVAAYSITNGDELWNQTVNGRARALAAAGGCLFVSTDTGNIYMFGPTQ
jgi:outer membrane protein assembly factor BamB